MVAVSRTTGGAGFPAPSIHVVAAEQIPGAQGTESPYLEPIANVVTGVSKNSQIPVKCPAFYITAKCENGHCFAKKLVCGKEYCPTCGADWSDAHKRRFSRWLPKAEQFHEVGYLVCTIPPALRYKYRDKDKLNELTKRMTCGDQSRKWRGVLRDLGFSRGFARWHWFGDKSSGFNPHLNIIIESGRLTKVELEVIKRRWARLLGVNMAVVNYSYTHKQAKMVHILKYVTRATFTKYEGNERLAQELRNFRNMRTWGKWTDAPAWELKGEPAFAHVEALESGVCPDCGKPIKWGHPIPIVFLQLEDAQDIGAGYYRLQDKPPNHRPQSSVEEIGQLRRRAAIALSIERQYKYLRAVGADNADN